MRKLFVRCKIFILEVFLAFVPPLGVRYCWCRLSGITAADKLVSLKPVIKFNKEILTHTLVMQFTTVAILAPQLCLRAVAKQHKSTASYF